MRILYPLYSSLSCRLTVGNIRWQAVLSSSTDNGSVTIARERRETGGRSWKAVSLNNITSMTSVNNERGSCSRLDWKRWVCQISLCDFAELTLIEVFAMAGITPTALERRRQEILSYATWSLNDGTFFWPLFRRKSGYLYKVCDEWHVMCCIWLTSRSYHKITDAESVLDYIGL